MNLTFDFRAGPLTEALERTVARVNVIWAKEHDPSTGAHTDITADSISVDGDLIVGGDIIGGGIGPVDTEHLTLKGNDPWLVLQDMDAPAGTQRWEMRVNGGPLTVSTMSDDGTTRTLAAQWTRSGTTPTSLKLETPLLVTAQSDGIAVWLVGRSSDNVAGLHFLTHQSVLAVTLSSLVTPNRLQIGFPSGYGYMFEDQQALPTSPKVTGLGHPVNRWRSVYSRWVDVSNDGGLTFDDSQVIGLFYQSGQLRLTNTQLGLSMDASGNVTTPKTLFASGHIVATSDAGGNGVEIRGRAGDNVAGLGFLNNAGTQNIMYLYAYTNTLEFRAPSGYSLFIEPNNIFRPSHDNVGQLGLPAYRWNAMRAYVFDAPTGLGSGYTFNATTNDCLYFDGTEVLLRVGGILAVYWHPTEIVNLVKVRFGAGPVYPTSDNDVDLGSASNRYRSVWVVGGVVSGSDERDKTEITDNLLGLDLLRKIRTVRYLWPHERQVHYGVLAQQLEAVGFDAVYQPQGPNERYGLNYNDLIGPLIRAVQELDGKVTGLCERLH